MPKGSKLQLYNTLTRRVQNFEPLQPDLVSLYVCGPTVYGPPHLGHARGALFFDLLVRSLTHLGHKVKYIRNITDVGHLVGDADEGQDKLAKAARMLQLHPMELAQQYTLSYHKQMALLGTLPPHIEPRATGHIPEQVALVQALLDRAFAYQVDGSVYFDSQKYQAHYPHNVLSRRKIEEQRTGSRTLAGQGGKRSPHDFALWKRAESCHIMRWSSPWSEGFPGWHLECTAMSSKYFGRQFDIHGGGLDLCFPHHDCEIAQGRAAYDTLPARYWLHHNMVTIQGQKMSKSLGNFITLQDCFEGTHPLLSQAYHPMVVRFFLLQSHYRSPVNFTDEGMRVAKKAYTKFMNGLLYLSRPYEAKKISSAESTVLDEQIVKLCASCHADLCQDLHTAKLLAHLSQLRGYINKWQAGALSELSAKSFELLKTTYTTFVQEVLGLVPPLLAKPMAMVEELLEQYRQAKLAQDQRAIDAIRTALDAQGIAVQDLAHSTSWHYKA